MKLIKQIAEENPCYRAGRTIVPQGLMLHSVGCPQPSAKVFADGWNRPDAAVCVHAVLQADGTVYQLLPWHWRAWHGGGSSNNTHIGVEMTEPDCIRYTGGASFVCSDTAAARKQVQGTYETAVALFAELCGRYQLDPMRAICSHAEGYQKGIASNHGDPEHLWKQLALPYTMDSFRAAVRAKLTESENTDSVEAAIAWLSKIGVMDTPAYWSENYSKVKYLNSLLEKAAAQLDVCGTPAETAEAGIDRLSELGVVDSPEHWKTVYTELPYLDRLLCLLGGCRKDPQVRLIWEIQAAIGVVEDGIAGPETLRHTPTMSAKTENHPAAVAAVQRCLYALGYPEVGQADGIAGMKFTQAVRRFQAEHGCIVDGELTSGGKTWRKLLGMK